MQALRLQSSAIDLVIFRRRFHSTVPRAAYGGIFCPRLITSSMRMSLQLIPRAASAHHMPFSLHPIGRDIANIGRLLPTKTCCRSIAFGLARIGWTGIPRQPFGRHGAKSQVGQFLQRISCGLAGPTHEIQVSSQLSKWSQLGYSHS